MEKLNEKNTPGTQGSYCCALLWFLMLMISQFKSHK